MPTLNHRTDKRHVLPPKARYAHSAQNVYKIRTALGFTQRDFAYYVRVAVPTVSNWETGRTMPSGLARQMIRHVAVEHGLDTRTLEFFDE